MCIFWVDFLALLATSAGLLLTSKGQTRPDRKFERAAVSSSGTPHACNEQCPYVVGPYGDTRIDSYVASDPSSAAQALHSQQGIPS